MGHYLKLWQINRVLLWLLLFINLMRFCVVFLHMLKPSIDYVEDVVQKYKSILWLTLKDSFMLYARYRFGRRCSSVLCVQCELPFLIKGVTQPMKLSSIFLIGDTNEKNSPSTCCGVFSGFTGHRHLQRYLQVCLLLNRYFIVSPSSGHVGCCDKHLTLYHWVNFWSFIDQKSLIPTQRTHGS